MPVQLVKIGPLGANYSPFEIVIQEHAFKNCRLKNIDHFISASMC